MGILSSKMDPIDLAKHYIEQLRDLKDRLASVSKTLQDMRKRSDHDVREYERLYEKEFEISITLYGLHGDVHKILDKCKTPENNFTVRRLKKEVDSLFTPLVIEGL